MSFYTSYDSDQGIVTVRFGDRTTRRDHYSARDEALRLCREHDCSLILVDLRNLDTHHYTVAGLFRFGESAAGVLRGLWIAHVLPSDIHSREDVVFTTSVASNRGALMAQFDNVEEATQWLLSKSRPTSPDPS